MSAEPVEFAEQRILAWLERADFTGEGCWHSQDTIARATGCCRRTVIRSVAALEADGRLSVKRFPRGSRRCNVYRVKHWNPHKRSGVLNVLGAIREARKSECHTKRTAASSRAHNAPASTAEAHGKGHRFLSADVLRTRSAGHGTTALDRASEISDFGRRSCMEQPKRRHLHVADLLCQHCAEKDAELERKAEIIRELQFELNRSMEAEAAANEVARAAGKASIAARSQLTKQAKAEAKAGQIEQVVEHWRYHRPKASSAFGKPGSKSYQIIDKALGLMADDPKGPVLACLEAIDGLHLAPWQEYDQRFARPGGPKRVLRNSIEHALGDEGRIERCRGILRKARGLGAQRVWDLYQALSEAERAWADEVLDLLREQPAPRERTVLVDGIPTKVDGR